MTDLEAIAKRRSRRCYTGGVRPEDVAPLGNLAQSIAQKVGLYMKLEPDAEKLFGGFTCNYGTFQGVKSLFVLAGPRDDEHGREKAGMAGERLVLQAEKRGLGTCWVAGSFDKRGVGQTLPEGFEPYAVITVGTVSAEFTGREKFIYRMMTHGGSKTVEQMYEADDAVPGWFRAGMEAVHRAPSSVNGQPVVFHWQGGRVTASVHNPKPMQLLDLGIAKLHFEIGAFGHFELGNGGRFAH